MGKVYPRSARPVPIENRGVFSTVFLFLALFSAGLTAFPLVFTSDRQAELTTCGCSVEQLGGLSRLPALLALHKLSSVPARLWVDGGDLFFSSLGLSEDRLRAEKERALILAKTYKKWGVSFLTPGPRDFAGGIATLKVLEKASGVKFLSANLNAPNGTPLFEAFALTERDGLKIAIVGISGKTVFEHVSEVQISEASKALTQAVFDSRAKGADMVVVLSHTGLENDKELAKIKGIDLWISGASTDVLKDSLAVGETRMGQILPLGQQVGIFHVLKKTQIRYEVVNVTQDFKEDKSIQRSVSSLKRGSKFIPDKGTKLQSKESRSFIANFETCRGCHAKQVEFWESTKHASAYLVLYGKNQHFDRECITCHTLGFESDKGFAKIAHPLVLKGGPPPPGAPFIEKIMETVFADAKVSGPIDSREQPEAFQRLKKGYHAALAELQSKGKLEKVFMGVQCEHCHGNRADHPAVGRAKLKVNAATCQQCHRPPHDSAFSFHDRIKKVSCPLLVNTGH